MKFEKTTYGGTKEILKYAEPYVAIPIMISASGIVADSDGKKIVKAGTPLTGNLTNRSTAFTKASTTEATDGTLVVPSGGGTVVLPTEAKSNAVGILLYDVDVTHGNAPGSLVIFGFIDEAKLPEAIGNEVKAALKMITFLK